MKPVIGLILPFILVILFQLQSFGQELVWQPVNGPYGLSISSLAVTRGGGLVAGGTIGAFFSNDRGDHWTRSSIDACVNSIFVSKDNEIFLGTPENRVLFSRDEGLHWNAFRADHLQFALMDQQMNMYAFDFYPHQLYRSTNKGVTWEPVALRPHVEYVNSLAADKGGYLYAATENNIVRSTDYGNSWAIVGRTSVERKSLRHSYYLSCGWSNSVWAFSSSGLFKSTNRGTSWLHVNNDLPKGIISQLVFTEHQEIFALGYFYAGPFHAVYKSTDTGRTWTQSFRVGRFESLGTLALDTLDNLYVGGLEIHRSIDRGVTWTKHSAGLTSDGVLILSINALGHIFAATSLHLFRSTDIGSNWSAIDSTLSLFKKFTAVLPFSEKTVFAGTAQNGLLVSTNNGDTWQTSLESGTQVESIVRQTTGGLFLATSAALYSSSDTGKSWVPMYDDLGYVHCLVASSDGIVLAGSCDPRTGESLNVYSCPKASNDWTRIGLDSSDGVSLVPSTGKSLFISHHGRLRCSLDGGLSWIRADSTAPLHPVQIVRTDQGILFAADDLAGVYCSLNDGLTWKLANRGLPTGRVHSMALHPNGHLFIGTRLGIYQTANPVSAVR